MSDPEPSPAKPRSGDDEPSKGPSLKLLYGILVLAMVVASGIALLIVLPFYHRR